MDQGKPTKYARKHAAYAIQVTLPHRSHSQAKSVIASPIHFWAKQSSPVLAGLPRRLRLLAM